MKLKMSSCGSRLFCQLHHYEPSRNDPKVRIDAKGELWVCCSLSNRLRIAKALNLLPLSGPVSGSSAYAVGDKGLNGFPCRQRHLLDGAIYRRLQSNLGLLEDRFIWGLLHQL